MITIRRILSGGSALLILGLIATTSQAQSRTWAKQHYDILIDGALQQLVEISTSDGLSPYLSRRLYGDDQGNLLVIRVEHDNATKIATTTIEHLETGETLSFHRDSPLTTVTLESQQLVIDVNEEIAYSGPEGSDFRPQTKNTATTLLASASPEFGSGLKRLVQSGCFETMNLYDVGVLCSHLFWNDIDCVDVPREQSTFGERVEGFDPLMTPPSTFEAQFGLAYFE